MERDKLLSTMDAKVWTDEFMATKAMLGDEEFDHAMMLAWFANAIMAGFDETNRCAQRALDAERANRLAMEACVDRDVKAIKDLKAQLATLQAQLRQAEGELACQKVETNGANERAQIVYKYYRTAQDELTTLRQLVEALPVVEVDGVIVWAAPDESGWFVSKRPAPTGTYWAKFKTQEDAKSFLASLKSRAPLVAQDAAKENTNGL